MGRQFSLSQLMVPLWFRVRVAHQPFSSVGPQGDLENDALWAHCTSALIKTPLLKVKIYLKVMLWKVHNPESSLGSYVWNPQTFYFLDTHLIYCVISSSKKHCHGFPKIISTSYLYLGEGPESEAFQTANRIS